MATRRTTEQSSPRFVVPARIRRCIVEDWTDPARVWSLRAEHGYATVARALVFAECDAWVRYVHGRNEWAAANGVGREIHELCVGGRPRFRDVVAFANALRRMMVASHAESEPIGSPGDDLGR